MSDTDKHTLEYHPQEFEHLNVLFKALVMIESAIGDVKRAGAQRSLSFPSLELFEHMRDVNGTILKEVKGRLVAYCIVQECFRSKRQHAKGSDK